MRTRRGGVGLTRRDAPLAAEQALQQLEALLGRAKLGAREDGPAEREAQHAEQRERQRGRLAPLLEPVERRRERSVVVVAVVPNAEVQEVGEIRREGHRGQVGQEAVGKERPIAGGASAIGGEADE